MHSAIKSCKVRVFRSHGLASEALYEVCRATTMAKLMYASPAWGGFESAHYRDWIKALIRKTKRLGYLQNGAPSVSQMASKVDDTLFRAITLNPEPVLNPPFPPLLIRDITYDLDHITTHYRERTIRTFIHRLLYKNIY